MNIISNFIVFAIYIEKSFLPYPLMSNSMEIIHMYGNLPHIQTVIISESEKLYLEKRSFDNGKK